MHFWRGRSLQCLRRWIPPKRCCPTPSKQQAFRERPRQCILDDSDDWDPAFFAARTVVHNGESSANVVKQVLHWSEIYIFLPTNCFSEGPICLGDDKEAREFLVEVVSSWIINGSQHLVVSFYLKEFKPSTSQEGWFIQEECTKATVLIDRDYLQTKCAIACIAGFFRLLTCLPLSRSKSHIPLYD